MADGTPEQVGASRSEWAKQFLKGEPDGPVRFHYDAPNYAHDLLGAAA